MDIKTQTYKGQSYKVCNDTWYSQKTPDDVIRVIEQARKSQTRIIIRLGYMTQADADAAGLGGVVGRDWLEENDCTGRVGRSMGPVKAPLMIVKPSDRGGGCIGTDHIVRIVTTLGQELYRHPQYHRPDLVNCAGWVATPSD